MTARAARKALEERHRRELDRAVEAVLDQPGSPAARRLLLRLERYRRLLDQLPPGRPPERLVALVIFCLSVAVLGVLWPWKVGDVAFDAEVQAVEVGVRPIEALDLSAGIEGTAVSLSSMSWIDPAPAGPPLESDDASASRTVTGGRVQLQRLTIERASRVVLRRGGGDLQLVIHGGALEGIVSHRPPEAEEGEFETVRFERRIEGLNPASLFFRDAKMDPAAGLQVDRIDFLRHQDGDSTAASPYRSSIVSGEVRVLPVGRLRTLHHGDRLRLGDAMSLERLEIEWCPEETITVRTAGTTNRLEAGPENYERDLMPSWLEVLSAEPTLGLLWAGLVFVSGVLWNVRKVLSG